MSYDVKLLCRDCDSIHPTKDLKICGICRFKVCDVCFANHNPICKNMFYDYRIHSPSEMFKKDDFFKCQIVCPICEEIDSIFYRQDHDGFHIYCDKCRPKVGYVFCSEPLFRKEPKCDKCGMFINVCSRDGDCFPKSKSCKENIHVCNLLDDYSRFHFKIAYAFPRPFNRTLFCFLMICSRLSPKLHGFKHLILKIIRML